MGEYIKDLQIHLAVTDDTNRIIDMLKQVAQWMKENSINQWRFLLEGGDDEEIEQAILNRNTYIVLKGYELVGTFTLLHKQSEWDRDIWGEDSVSNSLYLHRLALVPMCMKQGFGSKILNWIVKNTDSPIEYLKLDCVADNPKLNNFYKANGFELIGVTDGHSKYQKSIKG